MTRSWGRILLLTALALSLVLNFFLAGIIAKGIGDGLGGMVARRIANAYPEEFRTAFRAAMRDSRPQTFRALRDLRAAPAQSLAYGLGILAISAVVTSSVAPEDFDPLTECADPPDTPDDR